MCSWGNSHLLHPLPCVLGWRREYNRRRGDARVSVWFCWNNWTESIWFFRFGWRYGKFPAWFLDIFSYHRNRAINRQWRSPSTWGIWVGWGGGSLFWIRYWCQFFLFWNWGQVFYSSSQPGNLNLRVIPQPHILLQHQSPNIYHLSKLRLHPALILQFIQILQHSGQQFHPPRWTLE